MGLLLHYARDLLQRFAVAVFHNVFSGLELIVHIVFEDSSTTVLNSGRTLERLQPKFQRPLGNDYGRAQRAQADQLDP